MCQPEIKHEILHVRDDTANISGLPSLFLTTAELSKSRFHKNKGK